MESVMMIATIHIVAMIGVIAAIAGLHVNNI